MKLAEMRIQNFRAYEDEIIQFDDYSCLVGPNGCGKSTVLTALNMFFRNTADSVTDLISLTSEDFHQRNTDDPVRIMLTFKDLEPEAQTDFAHYYRQDRLIVSSVAVWDRESKLATVAQYGDRLGMKAFASFFEALDAGKLVAELKSIYAGLQKSFTGLPAAKTKQDMVDALHGYEAQHPNDCEVIPSEDQFYGVSRAKNLLEKYIQWAYIPAVKEPSMEQLESRKNALGILLERTVRSQVSFETPLEELRKQVEDAYIKILEDNRAALMALSNSLSARLQEWAHPDARLSLKWNDDASRAISISEPLAKVLAGEGLFEGELARFGHGFQRSFLLALLQELTARGGKAGPRLILACEEPELYQHPPQARHMASVLEVLSTQNTQVVLSTHSPHFVSGKGFESIRMFRKQAKSSGIHVQQYGLADLSTSLARAKGEKPVTLEGLALKVDQALNPKLNEMFFTSVLVLVEGEEDAAYISTYLTLLGLWEQFRALGCHIVAADCKGSMIQPLAIAKGLDIPTFVVFDADGHKPDNKWGSKNKHRKDNTTILRLMGDLNPEPFPDKPVFREDLVVWNSEIGEVVKSDFGEEKWQALSENVRKKYDLNSVGGLEKNPTFIGYLLVEGWEQGVKSDSMSKLCEAIMNFAHSSRSPQDTAGSPEPLATAGGAPKYNDGQRS